MSDVLAQQGEISLNIEQREQLLKYIKEQTGMVFAARLHSWVEKQFSLVFNAARDPDPNLFLSKLCSGSRTMEAQALFESLTVHETMFYRDKRYFAFLKDKLLPNLIEKNKNSKSLSIWIAAGSSGQEIYSILFTILDNFPSLSSWNLKLYSTDLSQQIIDKARKGIYEEHEIRRGMNEDGLAKYFDKVGDKAFQVKDQYRQKVQFSQSNLVEDFSSKVPNVDFTSCRNVLIYFNDETKQDIIKRLAKKINNGGYLILGQVDYINCKDTPPPLEYNIENSFPYFAHKG